MQFGMGLPIYFLFFIFLYIQHRVMLPRIWIHIYDFVFMYLIEKLFYILCSISMFYILVMFYIYILYSIYILYPISYNKIYNNLCGWKCSPLGYTSVPSLRVPSANAESSLYFFSL